MDGARSSVPGLTPAINLILPYNYPMFYTRCSKSAVFQFSEICLQNARDIMLALESTYREHYSRNLTLSRLNEAINLPLAPDKGASLSYDPNQAASTCLDNELKMLRRMQNLTE